MTEVKTLITAVGPTMWPLLERYSRPSFEWYAEEWGYDVKVETIEADGAEHVDPRHRAARWAKLGILEKTLKNCDTMVWFDADVVICRRDEDIANGLSPDCFQGLSLDWVPKYRRINPNTGVWVMRNTPEAFDFLGAVQEAGQQPGPWADQAAVMKVLGWLWDDDNYAGARPGGDSPYLKGTSWLSEAWNQPDLTAERCVGNWDGRPSVDNPHAVHFMGMFLEERTAKMGALVERLRVERTTKMAPTEVAS